MFRTDRSEAVVCQPSGWRAELNLGFDRRGERTVLSERKRQGPLTLQRPFYPEGGLPHVYLLHPPGGAVGGDELNIDVRLSADAAALITAPGAMKFYRSSGESVAQKLNLRLQSAARLEWLPQENIYFPGAIVSSKTVANLEDSSELFFWEIHCFGRPVIGEFFDSGHVKVDLEVRKNDVPVLIDRLRIDRDVILRKSGLASGAVLATAVIYPAQEKHASLIRDSLLLQDNFGVTVIEGMLVLRYIGDSTEVARNGFVSVWKALRPEIFDVEASLPRIWNT